MEAEELQLPAIPQSASEPRLPRPPLSRLSSRKRSTRSDEILEDDIFSGSIHTSSDPALFSSDETPDAENYSGVKRRKKKTYAGTWWGERLSRSRASSKSLNSEASSHKRGKRKFTRNFDSGIFMNSDDGSTELGSDSSFGQELLEEQKRQQEGKNETTCPLSPIAKLLSSPGNSSPNRTRGFRPTVKTSNEQTHAVSIVRACLDQGKEDVDLSGLGLETVPLELRELATMVKDEPAHQLQFDSFVARPRLYLSNNLLRQLPIPVMELANLRLLSLRQNKLTRLPPGIRNLVKLETLNISGNKLQYLPLEVFQLVKHHRLTELLSDPNPWLQYTDDQKEEFSNTSYVTVPRNGIAYTVGLRLIASNREHALSSTAESEKDTLCHVPPLSEVVLRQLSRINNSKRDLSPLMPADCPPRVTDMLRDLHSAQSEGDRRCAWCQRQYVTPAKKWIQWWGIKVRSEKSEPPHEDSMHDDRPQHVLPFEVGICGGCVRM